MNRGQDIARLGIPTQTRARPKGEQLSTRSSWVTGQQHQASARMLAAELADPRQLRQRIEIEDRHPWAMGTQDHINAIGFEIAREHLQPSIAVDHDPQAPSEEILKPAMTRVI